jgi:hypothetical protein
VSGLSKQKLGLKAGKTIARRGAPDYVATTPIQVPNNFALSRAISYVNYASH